MSEGKKNVPALRFKGFTDDWEQEQLKNLVRIIGGGTPSTTTEEYWNGNINWYTPKEIGKDKFLYNSERTITELGLEKSSAKLLPAENTLLFTSRASIGDFGILRNQAATNQGFQSFVVNPDNVNIYFLYGYAKRIKDYALKHAIGSTFMEISGKELGEMGVNFPKINEQKNIGKFLELMDNLITLYQRKIHSVKALKHAYLKLVFTNNNSNPLLRFQGFTDDWEQCFYSSAFNNFVYGIGASAKNYDGKYKYLRITDIDEEKRTINFDKLKSPDASENDLKKYILKENDIVFARTGASVGKSYLFDSSHQNIVFAGYLIRGEVSEEYNSEFIFLQSLRESFKRYIEVSSMRSGQPGINPSELGNFKFNTPKIQEQKQISSLFVLLDSLITLYQHKLDNLTKIKNIYLKKLFI